jgi:hypothetical protein
MRETAAVDFAARKDETLRTFFFWPALIFTASLKCDSGMSVSEVS